MRKRFSYANVAATLALVFSMTGGALAANHYLISSTKQIKPSVLKKLTGKKGATGATGAAGTPGASGKEGPQGKEGVAGSAVAFAHILGKTSPLNPLDAANSKNVSAVSEPMPGLYCITTTVPIKNIAGTPDAASGLETIVGGNFTVVPLTIEAKDCPPGTTVLGVTSVGGTETSADFWISFN